MARVAGSVWIFVDGKQLSVSGSVSISGFDTMKEGVVGLSGFEGHKEVPTIPFIEVTLTKKAESDKFNDLQKLENAVVEVQTAVGTFTLRDAYVKGEPAHNPETGELTVRFEGAKAIE